MKNPYRITTLLLFTILAVLLAACGSNSLADQKPPSALVEDPVTDMDSDETDKVEAVEVEKVAFPISWVEDVPQSDEQGAVVVEIVPLNPNNPGHTLDFSVSLNTHSVDLSMDLAALATLETDTGYTVQATLWDAPQGGHHVSGTLSFPAGVDGYPILEGVTNMTIRLVDVDAPERIFAWAR